MDTIAPGSERRRHQRIVLGLPVRVFLKGGQRPLTLEMVDVSAGGSAFRTGDARPRMGQRAAFGFVMNDQCVCLARGRVVRLSRDGFAMRFDQTNTAFRGFLGDVSGPSFVAA